MSHIRHRSQDLVSLSKFSSAGIPIIVDKFDIECPHDRQYILRMAIRVDGGDYHIPSELDWLIPIFKSSLNYQKSMGINHPFCYITVRHGEVTSQEDDEWHVDGFSIKVPHTPEQNYIWCNRDATEYAELKVEFPEDFDARVHNVNHYLQNFINDENIGKCEEFVLYCMDPYNVHRRPITATGMNRTFVRISFAPIEINDINNTQNPALHRIYDQNGVKFRKELLTY